MTQMFHKGDLVHVAKDLGPMMSHFENDTDAIVIGSYKDQFGGDNVDSFTLHLEGRGQASWYYGCQLTLLEKGRHDLLDAWQREEREKAERESNLSWIFNNGAAVMKSASGATVAALARCMGITNLWGSAGEGITLYEMSRLVMSIAHPFLWYCDEDGFVEYAAQLRDRVRWPYGCGRNVGSIPTKGASFDSKVERT